MFTGIIRHQGTIESFRNGRLAVSTGPSKDAIGASVAVNGVCLTVTKREKKKGKTRLFFDVSPETLRKTTLGRLVPGTSVNLERPLTLKDGLDGHIVQGHVDGVGRVIKIEINQMGAEIWFEPPNSVEKLLVQKGSVAIDGVSLTVAALKKKQFSVALIPQTLKETNLKFLKKGSRVNFEGDIFAKYVLKYAKKT